MQVQLFGAVHSLLIPQTGLQIANKIIVTIVLCVYYIFYIPVWQSLQVHPVTKYRSSIRYIAIPVKQLLPVHPLTHVQVSGTVHRLFVPHGGMQIAVLV